MARTVLFDRYRLLEPAGTRGSAEVWRARDLRTGDTVAVKRLHPIVFADEAGRQRLRREFETLRSLAEPHVVRVRDLEIGKREGILVLDFVDGPSLAHRLAGQSSERPAVARETATAIIADVAAALSAAHAAGIVHRDVSPGNILLDSDDEARLTDFGIAHASGDAAITATGLVMGTLRYVAPEQLRGERATPASDLYGLAAVAYELFAGRPAYDATTPVALAAAQEHGPLPIERVPPGVDAAIRRSLAADPAGRAEDVASFAASLATAFADEATVAIPAPVRAAGAERTAALPIVAAKATPAGPPLAAATPVASSAAQAPAGTRPDRRVPAAVAAILVVALLGALAAAAERGPVGANGTGEAASGRPTAPPTARPAPTRAPAVPKPAGGNGKGHGNGHGNDQGD